jgi:hypothetical protein
MDPDDPDRYRPWLSCLQADDLSAAPIVPGQRAVAHDVHGNFGVVIVVDDATRELVTVDAVHDGHKWKVIGCGVMTPTDASWLAAPPLGLRNLGGGGSWGIAYGEFRYLILRAAPEIHTVRLITSDRSSERRLQADGFLALLTVPGEPITYLQGVDHAGNDSGDSLLL